MSAGKNVNNSLSNGCDSTTSRTHGTNTLEYVWPSLCTSPGIIADTSCQCTCSLSYTNTVSNAWPPQKTDYHLNVHINIKLNKAYLIRQHHGYNIEEYHSQNDIILRMICSNAARIKTVTVTINCKLVKCWNEL